jgi:phosphotransferase system enzyme I (PtsI)
MGQSDDEAFGLHEHKQVVIVAHELYPGLTVQLDRDQLVGLVSEEGTRTSHAAILAHSLGIPCVMGVPGAVTRIRSDTLVLVDGTTGTIVLEPTMAELEAAQTMATRRHNSSSSSSRRRCNRPPRRTAWP